MKTEKFDVTGMTCSSCVAHVEKSVRKLDGVKKVNVNLLTNSMTVDFDDNQLEIDSIERSVRSVGYEAHVKNEVTTQAKPVDLAEKEREEMKFRWITSLTFLLPLLYVSMGHMVGMPHFSFFHGSENAIIFAFTQFLLTLPIVLINKKYFTNGFGTLFKGTPNMDSLVAIGSAAAILYGIFAIFKIGYGLGHADIEMVTIYGSDLYFESGATILTLITLGKYLEAKSKSRTSDAITRLMDLAPKTATVIRLNQEIELPIEAVVVNDLVIVKPGQTIPVDGIVEEGSSSVDESALTGESIPVFKQKGDTVLSASINKLGKLTFRATKVGRDTTLSQIIQLVEDASSTKAPISKLADKISGIFVPVVIGIAILTTATWMILGYPFDFALSIGIAVLVISCPCALGLATPVAIMVGTGMGAEHGILIKSAESLEIAHKIDTVVLDKTGTLTQGKPVVTDIYSLPTITNDQLLRVAASLEKHSEHPLAEAILSEAGKHDFSLYETTYFQALPGLGLEGEIDNLTYLAGNLRLMNERNIALQDFETLSNQMAEEGKTPLFIANDREVLGIIAVADTLKPTSKQAVDELKAMGLNVIMLTGDHAKTAAYIQTQLGISTVVAEVMPQDKDKEISKLLSAGKMVAMVGDGINDAPALVRSNLGIAIGAGTDVAIASADIVLMRSDLLDAVTALRLGKAVIVNIKQNLFWAFFYNIIGIPLAAGLFYSLLNWKLNPMFAAAAMSLSSVTVVINALRLLQFKTNHVGELNSTSLSDSQTPNKDKIMTQKTLKIEGMSCGHCSARVEKALNAINGVEAKVDLAAKTAQVNLTEEVSEEILKKAVTDAGYEVV
jgi:P-type Cu+ transporter